MFLCYECDLLRGYSEKGQYKNSHQRDDIHDIVEDEIENGVFPQFGDAHHETDRGKINLTGANYGADSDNESGTEGGQQTSFEPGLFSDDSMDLSLHTHW